jgi:hypothetical protein
VSNRRWSISDSFVRNPGRVVIVMVSVILGLTLATVKWRQNRRVTTAVAGIRRRWVLHVAQRGARVAIARRRTSWSARPSKVGSTPACATVPGAPEGSSRGRTGRSPELTSGARSARAPPMPVSTSLCWVFRASGPSPWFAGCRPHPVHVPPGQVCPNPSQAVSQQMSSAGEQKPERHCSAFAQVSPLAFLGSHFPPKQ